MNADNVSHGRGGQGNIGPDETSYVDGEIHREGDPNSAAAAYSTGRGGVGNMGSPKAGSLAEPETQNDKDVVPEVAKVEADDTFHSGRGGEGNAHISDTDKEKENKKAHDGLADKLKKRLSSLLSGRKKQQS